MTTAPPEPKLLSCSSRLQVPKGLRSAPGEGVRKRVQGGSEAESVQSGGVAAVMGQWGEPGGAPACICLLGA